MTLRAQIADDRTTTTVGSTVRARGRRAVATVRGFDPASGAETAANNRDLQAQAAVAAVADAIAKGDKRRVQDFSNVDITGITV